MKKLFTKANQLEFEYRIFVSFLIVISIYVLSITLFKNEAPTAVLIGNYLGLTNQPSLCLLYVVLSVLMLFISLLRMWAGSILNSQTVMSFRVQTGSLMVKGPYLLVRNPIYLADILAICCFSLCLPVIGILMPLLFYLHYNNLIKYEEIALEKNFKKHYDLYINRVPRLIATPKSILDFVRSKKNFSINKDGFRHNALYMPFIPGFILSAITQDFTYTLIIGIPGVIDWAIVHTRIGLRNSKSNLKAYEKSRHLKKKVFNDIVYAQCWEDPSLDRKAFNIQPEDVIFSISSGGDNILTFLIDNPAKIIALDLNPHQNFLLSLKIAAFKRLSYQELLEFFGIYESRRRMNLYREIRSTLNVSTRDYWDTQQDKLKGGIIHCGRYEHYMRLLRTCLVLIMGRSLLNKFFLVQTSSDRIELYNNHWNNIGWKIFTRILLSRKIMSFLFDKSFFFYLEKSFSFGKHFSEKVKRALTVLPVRINYFLSYILLGNYKVNHALPCYLRSENYTKIRNRVNRIDIVTDSCNKFFTKLPDSCISKFNFSNIFEWMSYDDYENLLRQIIRIAKDGAILTYRNLLVPRSSPVSLSHSIKLYGKFAQFLHQKDLSFIYNNYVVEQIKKDTQKWPMKSEKYLVENP